MSQTATSSKKATAKSRKTAGKGNIETGGMITALKSQNPIAIAMTIFFACLALALYLNSNNFKVSEENQLMLNFWGNLAIMSLYPMFWGGIGGLIQAHYGPGEAHWPRLSIAGSLAALVSFLLLKSEVLVQVIITLFNHKFELKPSGPVDQIIDFNLYGIAFIAVAVGYAAAFIQEFIKSHFKLVLKLQKKALEED